MSLRTCKRGDAIFVIDQRYRKNVPPSEYDAVIVSAGPKYVTAKSGHLEWKFHRDTGVQVTAYTAQAHAYLTRGEWVLKCHRDQRLSHAEALMRQMSVARRLSPEALEQLIAILEAA